MKNMKFINIKLSKKRQGASIIIMTFGLIAVLSLAGLVVDLGIILNSRHELQKVVETTALASIAEYEAYENNVNVINYPTDAQISTIASNNFNAFIKSNSVLRMSANVTSTVTFGTLNPLGLIPAPATANFNNMTKYSRAIRIDASDVARTYFLSIIGIRTINIQASAAAIHLPLYLRPGNILNGDSIATGGCRDTDVRDPVGGSNAGVPYNATINGVVYSLPIIENVNKDADNISGVANGTVLSLGPGGYITLKPPSTIVDGKGFDLQIITRGNANGYFVFVGNDTDPSNPYVDAATPGGGINWVNISCTGTPVGAQTNGRVGSYNQWIDFNANTAVDTGETQAKFYGSGYFDLSASCTDSTPTVTYNGNVKTAKYLKIIDDNIEDGFIAKNPRFDADLDLVPSFFPAQNSSLTPGVSIDAVAIEHHPRLISIMDFNKDTDADGLIDVVETSMGLLPTGSTDGSVPNNDAGEFWGYNTSSANILQDNPTNALRIDYANLMDDAPKIIINY